MKVNKRFFEIDALRGIAIILMILYHTFYDINYFLRLNFDLWSGPLWFIGRGSATLFIFLVGISLTLSYSKIKDRYSKKEIFNKYSLRGLKIISWGFLITIITHQFLSEGTIYFGILHFIGLAIIIAIPFLRLKQTNLILGSIILLIGTYLKTITINTPYLLFLGLRPESFYTLDYFPIFPWFGILLIGIYFGNKYYPEGKQKIKIPELKKQLKPLSYIGQKSLLIYLIHQPILIGLILLIKNLI